MNSRAKSSELLRYGFTAAYTAVVLPFTVHFFKEFVTKPDGDWQKVSYGVGVVAFLAFLEYVGVSLACDFWRELDAERLKPRRSSTSNAPNSGTGVATPRHHTNPWEFFGLFFLCQTLAVVTTFYDAREAVWNKVHTDFITTQTRKQKEAATAGTAVQAQIDRFVADRKETREALTKEASRHPESQVPIGSPDPLILQERNTQRSEIIRQHGNVLRSLQEQIDADTTQLNALQSQQNTPSTVTSSDQETNVEAGAPTALEYIGRTFGQAATFFTLFVASLFPITILGFARLVTRMERPKVPLAAVDLSRELEEGAKFPPERHESYAASIEPVLAAHIATLRAVRGNVAKSLGLQLELDAELDVLESISELKVQVESSGLSEGGKSRLREFLDKQLEANVATST